MIKNVPVLLEFIKMIILLRFYLDISVSDIKHAN